MGKYVLAGWVLIAVWCLATAAAIANEPVPIEKLIRERAETLLAKPGILGVAVGVQIHDKSYAFTSGRASLIRKQPVDEDTLFEIGSITKAFTGLLLADAVVRGELDLDTPVSALLGPDVTVPTYDGRPIRLVDLATHTSGLPRLPSNTGLFNPLNPYASYTTARLESFLAKYKLDRAPGAAYEYSNLGMGLLGHALAQRAGKSYEELLRERIWRPLEMDDTSITLSADQRSRLAQGSASSFLIPIPAWDFQALAGCGAIRSTLDDMMKFLRANMSPDATPLANAIRLSHKPRATAVAPNDRHGPNIEVGLAWHITTENGVSIIWHNGMTGGYAAYLGFILDKDVGIVVLSNTASVEIDRLGSELLTELMSRAERQTYPSPSGTADGN